MKRVLFVDDEQQILDALQNVLRRQRKHWEMVFALGGDAALAEMQKQPFDVVVSDMRMPGMDGATLLGRVKERYPATTRLILSGHAEREAVMRSLAVAHQFLAKPCSEESLRLTIERVCNVRQLIENPAVRAVVESGDVIGCMPETYRELNTKLSDPRCGSSDISDIVRRDPAMAARALQLVNSGFFGLRQPVSEIGRAIAYLGVEVIKGLALDSHVFKAFEDVDLPGLSLEKLHNDSLQAAMEAKAESEEAFTAALLSDVGVLVMAKNMRERYGEVLARTGGEIVPEVEREMLGISHAEVGAYLLGAWGVPMGIVQAVAFHHETR